MPNLLQDNVHKSEDDVIENEVLTGSCESSEPSSITPNNKSKGNAHETKLTEGESFLDVLNFSTNHAMIEQILVDLRLFYLSHKKIFLMFLVINMTHMMIFSVIPMQPLMNDHAYVGSNQTLVLKIEKLFIMLVMLMS
jgi:hypothetical protein